MSRLASLSPAALRAMFSQESDDTLITLVTITSGATTIRLADNYTGRLSETADDIVYGVTSRGNQYIFLPLRISLPTEDQSSAPRVSITINDVTRYLTPIIRGIVGAPSVTLELVLASTPDTVEATFPGFLMSSITYNQDSVSAELSVESLTAEPFPAHTITPSYFPGIF